jgi:hypothetical protein
LSPFSATIVQISSNLRNDWDVAIVGCKDALQTRNRVRGYGRVVIRGECATAKDFMGLE